MATDITAVIGVNIRSTLEKTAVMAAPGGGTTRESTSRDVYIEEQADPTYSFGVGPSLAKGHFHGRWNVAAAAQVTFDLNGVAGAPMTDTFGDRIDATEIKVIYLHNRSTTTGDTLEVLGDQAAGINEIRFMLVAADAVNLGPNGVLLLTSPVDGFAVVGAATDVIEIDNNAGNTIEFEVYILYEHA